MFFLLFFASYFPIGRSLFDKQDLLEVIAGGFFGFKRTVIEPIIEINTPMISGQIPYRLPESEKQIPR